MQDPKEPPRKSGEESRVEPPRSAAKRRPYEPPRIVSRDKLEGRANVCDAFTGKQAPPSCGVARS